MLFNNWKENLQPLLERYKNKKHPLAYKNTYQLLIMVILSARDSDANINKVTILFFEKYPNMESLSNASVKEVTTYIQSIKNYNNKAKWIFEIASILKTDENIPKNLTNLIDLKGIGRKSANVILRETNQKSEGIIVDLHVIRVAPRIGLTPKINNGDKIEKKLMNELPYEIWHDIGMSLSFLGREICRPTNPKCTTCPINIHCNNYKLNTQ
ncbi:endonuclease III [Flavobacterium jejuense]|uniref:Endonuclease III n=1 Tax=Flavobacterium jejuense TaxID=1544455 RepID=A0ABX0IVT5_9FLAO|nr:endonuclease III [Flavobacterium jejuense]NHN27301.1 endonuclease III [Flavobacterium jejuense]